MTEALFNEYFPKIKSAVAEHLGEEFFAKESRLHENDFEIVVRMKDGLMTDEMQNSLSEKIQQVVKSLNHPTMYYSTQGVNGRQWAIKLPQGGT